MEVLNDIVIKSKTRTDDEDFLDTAWLIEDAEMNASRAGKSCMEVLQETLSSECNVHLKTHAPCAKRWLIAALEVLSKNNTGPISFVRQVVNTLTKGRGKGSNLFIVGPENCAKSFMRMSLSIMFDCFLCPSNSKLNYVTAIDKEIMFFNDLRYGPNGKKDDRFLPWNQFLNLLEDAPVNVAMFKNVYASDQEWTAL